MMVLIYVFSQVLIFQPVPVQADEQAILTINGSGVNHDVYITDWSSYQLVERIYSSNNSFNFHKIVKGKGYDLFELIGVSNLKTNQNYDVLFTCSDGYQFTKSISELKSAYYYPDFTEKSKVASAPMLAVYSTVLADYAPDKFLPPTSFVDKPLQETDLDKDAPKLMFGQTGIDDMNMPKWGKKIVEITVGELVQEVTESSSYKHISYAGAPYNVDAISGATFTVEGPGVEGYRAISIRQIEEDLLGQSVEVYEEMINGKAVENSYEGIQVKYLLDHYVKVKANAGNVVFKDKGRKTILTVPIEEMEKYIIAYGVNEVPLVYLKSDVGYLADKYNDNGCLKLVYQQSPETELVSFSNVAYLYVEEKDAKEIYEHSYAPYNDPKYNDYEIVIHGDGIGDSIVSYTVEDIENMKSIQTEKEYSLSNSEYFWYYNSYKGVPLWDLLIESGLDPNIAEETTVRIIAADNYNFSPLTIKEIKDNSLYGYYEKSNLDKGDGNFSGKDVDPLYTGLPVLVAYGFNGYPYVINPTDEGYNPGLGNDGGPLRVIFGKTDYQHNNGSYQVQFLKEIIVGEGEQLTTAGGGVGDKDLNELGIEEGEAWTHSQGDYQSYLDLPVLRVTGSQVAQPTTFTLREIEDMLEHAVRDIYTGDGVRTFEGIVLWDLIKDKVGLKEGVEAPSIRVFSGQNFNKILQNSGQVINGVLNSKKETKQIILAYAVDGYPLVPNESDLGYVNNNAYGPLRLIVEENKSMWVKWVDCIVVGSGDYEKPVKEADQIWLTYLNDTGKELPEASVRSMLYDEAGDLWIGTNGGGIAVRDRSAQWTTYDEILTENAGTVKVDTCYAIALRENGDLWFSLGGFESAKGILVKKGEVWTLVNKENSLLPSDFVQVLEADENGGLWIGSGSGAVYVDNKDKWTVYTKEDGLALDSVNTIAPDKNGGAWIGFYPNTVGSGADMLTTGAYQYLAVDGTLTTYSGFDPLNFNLNWVRSIVQDDNGGIWVTRSGNAMGLGHGEIDYILDGEVTTYKAEELYPDIAPTDNIRFVKTDAEGRLYIATQASGLLISDRIGEIREQINSKTIMPSEKWDNVFFVEVEGGKILLGTNGGAGVYTSAIGFDDVRAHWAQEEVTTLATMGYLKGDKDHFLPDRYMTRAEFVSLLLRIIGKQESVLKEMAFSDVKDTAWYAVDISQALSLGWIKGYEDGTFRPDTVITREEAGQIIGLLMNNEITPTEADEVLNEYTDAVSDWAKISMAKMTRAGIIEGMPDKTLAGGRAVTRAEAAIMLLRFLRY